MRATLVLTHACNLACTYCYMGEHHAAAMSEETARRVVDQVFDAPGAPALSFFGGEPLLAWERLVACVRHARALEASRGVAIEDLQVTTNGTLITADRARFFKDEAFRVAISLDGDREAHESGRPQKGGASSFDAVIAGIDALRAASVPFDVIAVTTPENARRLSTSVAFLLGLGPERIVLSPAYEREWTDADLEIWERELERIGHLHEAAFRAGNDSAIATFETKITAALKGGRTACSAGERSVAVTPRGNLYPCERLVGEDRDPRLVIGHLDDGLDGRTRIARGPAAEECGPCPERYRCGSSCACANVAETGDPTLPGGVQCWYEQTVARIADRIAEALLDDPRFLELAYPSGTAVGGAEAATGKVERARPKRRLPIAEGG